MLTDINQPFPGSGSTVAASGQHTGRMSAIFELLLQPIFELVFYTVGYVTAWILVPVFTFGHVSVEPGLNGIPLEPRRGRIQRIAPAKYVMSAELGSIIGGLFWILVVVGYFLVRSNDCGISS